MKAPKPPRGIGPAKSLAVITTADLDRRTGVLDEDLRDSRAQLAGMIASAMDAIITIDDRQRVVVFNSAAEKMFGCSRDQAIGQTIDKFIPERFRAAHHGHVSAFRETGVTKRSMGALGSIFGLRTSGDEFPIEASISQIQVRGQRLFTVILRDVTERAQADKERTYLLDREKAARAEAEAANRAKDEFLATVSHELRTPLSAILGWARLLAIGKLDPEAASKAIETIERNAKAQAQLIEDLLDMSRVASGKLKLEVAAVSLVQIIERAVETSRPSAQAKTIQLTAELDPTAEGVEGDATRLEQVIGNLLSNAIKFTPKGGRVNVRLERNDSKAKITVSDTGRGIRPEFLPRVFDRFQQADSKDTRQHGGLGIGLTIARNLVETHGGTINGESPGEGQGATFTVRLPLKTSRTEAIRREETRSDPGWLPWLGGLRVLVVDDEPSAREVVGAVLSQCGAKVTLEASAADALATLGKGSFDVLISDIAMPGENGYELIAKVRALKPEQGGNIPAVALTAYAKPEDRIRALTAGFQTFVPKPVEPDELAIVVGSVAERANRAS